MRMWMIDPRLLCRQHLLGEHVEIHMLVGHLAVGHSVDGYLERGLVEPQNAVERHDELAREITRRGHQHTSSIRQLDAAPEGRVDRSVSLAELRSRCSECRRRQEQYEEREEKPIR